MDTWTEGSIGFALKGPCTSPQPEFFFRGLWDGLIGRRRETVIEAVGAILAVGTPDHLLALAVPSHLLGFAFDLAEAMERVDHDRLVATVPHGEFLHRLFGVHRLDLGDPVGRDAAVERRAGLGTLLDGSVDVDQHQPANHTAKIMSGQVTRILARGLRQIDARPV